MIVHVYWQTADVHTTTVLPSTKLNMWTTKTDPSNWTQSDIARLDYDLYWMLVSGIAILFTLYFVRSCLYTVFSYTLNNRLVNFVPIVITQNNDYLFIPLMS